MPLPHVAPHSSAMGVDALLACICDRIEALKQAGEAAALKAFLARVRNGVPVTLPCLPCSDDVRGVFLRLDAMLHELLRRDLFAFESLLAGELEDLKNETIARTPGGLDACGIEASAAGVAGEAGEGPLPCGSGPLSPVPVPSSGVLAALNDGDRSA